MKIPASRPDNEPDDPRSGDRGEDSHSDASSSSVSMSQSTRDEESSAAGGSAAPGDDSPSASADGDRDPERTRELAAANAEDIDSLEATVNWVVKFVVERTDPPGETAAGTDLDTADRGFQ